MVNANIYDICDLPVLTEDCRGGPGLNLRFVYTKLAGQVLLKHLILKGCRHPGIPLAEIPLYQGMMRLAMQATYDDWRDPSG